MWNAQVDTLSQHYRVIAPDLRGFGQSRRSDAFSIESLADDVALFLEQLSALPCVLAGLSMGGYVSLAYAKKYPKDLRGLILVDTKAEADTPEGKAGRKKMIALVRESGSKAVAEQMMPENAFTRNTSEPSGCGESAARDHGELSAPDDRTRAHGDARSAGSGGGNYRRSICRRW